MQKLVTPVQYENTLDGLNAVRPLVLADEVKPILDIPVLNANPVSENRPAIGKLLRCNQNGALVTKNHNGFKYYQTKSLEIDSPNYFNLCTFSQKVEGILLEVTDSANITAFGWFWLAGFAILEVWNLLGTTWSNFDGQSLYIKISGATPYHHYFNVHGFYN